MLFYESYRAYYACLVRPANWTNLFFSVFCKTLDLLDVSENRLFLSAKDDNHNVRLFVDQLKWLKTQRKEQGKKTKAQNDEQPDSVFPLPHFPKTDADLQLLRKCMDDVQYNEIIKAITPVTPQQPVSFPMWRRKPAASEPGRASPMPKSETGEERSKEHRR